MILRLPGLIARLAGLDGVPHRNHLLVEVNSLEEITDLEKKMWEVWRREYCDSSAKYFVKRSLDAAMRTIGKTTQSLQEM